MIKKMNIDLILSTGIENIDIVYGGVRGTTLSSRHNMRHWQAVVQSGIKTIVELRDNDQRQLLSYVTMIILIDCVKCAKNTVSDTSHFQWIAIVFLTK